MIKGNSKYLCLSLLCLFLSNYEVINAQSNEFSLDNQYGMYRLLLNSGSLDATTYYPIRLGSMCVPSTQKALNLLEGSESDSCENTTHKRWELSDLSFFSSYNTSHPSGRNDGPIWQGVGLNSAVSFGGSFRWKYLTLKLNPVFGFSQNKAYDLHPYPYRDNQPNSYWIQRVDYVQRYGDSRVLSINPGESEFSFKYKRFETGVSTTQFISGPGIQTSLIYGMNAPGIPRVFLGTSRPVNIYVGQLGVNYFYGFQKKSDYLDLRTDNRLTTIHNLQVVYNPSFAPNLQVGLNRTYQEFYSSDFNQILADVRKMFDPFTKKGLTGTVEESADPDNQLAVVFFRWAFPKQQFEIYGEWGRNDHSVDLDEFFIQPDHYRAYLFGGLKSFKLDQNRLLGIGFELNHLDAPRNSLIRLRPTNPFGGALGPWGTHHAQVIGLTNKGQLLGNGYGLGANVRTIRIEYLNDDSFTRVTLNKIAHNPVLIDDPRYRRIVDLFNDTFSYAVRMTEFLATVHHTRTVLNGTEIGVGLDLSYTLHRYHISQNNAINARFEFTLRQPLNLSWGGL